MEGGGGGELVDFVGYLLRDELALEVWQVLSKVLLEVFVSEYLQCSCLPVSALRCCGTTSWSATDAGGADACWATGTEGAFIAVPSFWATNSDTGISGISTTGVDAMV